MCINLYSVNACNTLSSSTFTMEFQFSSGCFSIISAFFLFIVMLLEICRGHKTSNSIPKLPPGPWKLPIIGNMHQLVGSLPHHILRDLANIYGPLMHLQLGEVSTVIVSAPEAAKEIMRTHDSIFAFRPLLLTPDIISYGGAGIAFAPYGDYWRQMRKFCGSVLLNSKRVESFQLIREEEVSHLLEFIFANIGLPINLGEQIFSMTYGMTARVAFGNKCKEHEALITAVREGAEATGGFAVADIFPSVKILHVISGMRPNLEKIHRGLHKILENIVKDHKASKTKGKDRANDLLSVLLNLQELGNLEVPLTNDHIKAVMLDIFTAGSETSSSTVEWATSEMVKTPRVMEKAQEEVRQVFGAKGNVDETSLQQLKFLKAVIKETLRLHPPIPLLLPKECSESCEINGYGIPLKTKVIVNAWAIGRDPKPWTEAETFYPERFIDSSIDYGGPNFEFIPFGGGRRICPGIAFATPNIELPLAQLVFHFEWKLPEDGLDMTENFSATVRKKKELHVLDSCSLLSCSKCLEPQKENGLGADSELFLCRSL